MAETRKPDKLYGTHPKNYGKGARPCRVTGRLGGHGLIRKYGINMKRQTFRERALDMGWMKYSWTHTRQSNTTLSRNTQNLDHVYGR